MKYLSIFLIILIIFCAFGCSNPKYNVTNDIEMQDSLINNDDSESLAFWTADTIIKTNPRLVILMDTLYRYTRNEFHLNDVMSNRKWMKEYRNQLCNYYKKTHQSDSLSEFAMVDSIIAEADTLWNLDNDESTMGIIINNDIKHTRLIFEQFNEYEKLNSICENEEQKEILLAEFTEWLKFESLFCELFANCVDLYFWGGTISGPIRTSGVLNICEAHIDLYKKEYLIISNSVNQWEDNGTFLRPAQNLLISCSKQAVDESYYPKKTNAALYDELHKSSKSLLKELPMQMDAWCKSRQGWEEEMSTTWLRPVYARHTSEVLIKLT